MKNVAALAALLIIPMTASLPAMADSPGAHPHYLHALSDLRLARALLVKNPETSNVAATDNDAVAHVNRAIAEIKRAAIDDGKNIGDHTPIDTHLPRRDRFDKALDLLAKADRDLHYKEDDHAALGWRKEAIHNVKEAISYTRWAIRTEHFDDSHP
jgi:hypothetical protein